MKQVVSTFMNEPGTPSTLMPRKIHLLNGGRKINKVPLITSHGDVSNAAVTWAVASLVASV
jgi:hypothetical protein